MSTVLHPEINEATSDTTWLGYHLQSPSPGTVTLHPGTIPGGEHGRITCKVLNELIYMDHQLYRLLCETPTYASISSNLKKNKPRVVISMAFNWGRFCSPGNMWHYLEIFSNVTTWGECSKLAICVGQLRLQSIIVRHCLLVGIC